MATFDDLSFEGLKEFVANQNPNKIINHATWSSCAVGEYIETTLDLDKEAIDLCELSLLFAQVLEKAMSKDAYAILGNAHVYNLNTYKQLNTFLKSGNVPKKKPF